MQNPINKKILLAGLFIWLFCIANINGQVPSFIHYEVGNGLPSNELYNLKQDSKGYLWIGTDAGLTRYNGKNFTLYNNKLQRGASVTGIQEDSKGNIWCHNFGGQVLVVKNDSLTIFEPWSKFYNNQLIEIALDKKDNLYVSNFRNYIYKFNLKNNSVTTIEEKNSVKQSISIANNNQLIFSNLTTRTVNTELNGKILALSFKGYQNLQPQDSVLNTFVFFNSTKGLNTTGFQRQHHDDKFPTLYNLVNNTLQVHPLTSYLRQNNIYPLSLLNDDEGNIFIGTFKGCYWFKEKNNEWQFQHLLFSNKAISSIIRDREGSYWFATLKNGLYQIPNLAITIFREEDINMSDNVVGNLATDSKTNLYVSGLGKEISLLKVPENKLQNQYITSAIRDVQGFLYDTLFKRLIFYKDALSIISNNILKEYPAIVSAPKDFYVRKDGVIFSAGVTLTALYPGNLNKKILLQEFTESEGLNLKGTIGETKELKVFNISAQRSRAVTYDEENNILWSANADGTVYYQNKTLNNLIDEVSKQKIIATCFAKLNNGNICIGTIEQGVYIVKNTSIIKHFTTANGLQSNRIKKIKTFNDNIIIATNLGIQKINLSKNTFTNFTITNGLASSEVFDIVIAANNIYVSTSKGLQCLPLELTVVNTITPYLHLKKTITADSIYTHNEVIELIKDNSSVAFDLDGVALKSRGNFSYQYRLLGLDSNWITVDAGNNIIRYPSLPSGNYIFEAVCTNEDGIKSTPVKAAIYIKNPWWQRWWFVTLLSFIAFYIVFTITKNNLTKKRIKVEEALKQSKMQEELRLSQLSSLKAQMNPHFMFNALNSIQEFILLNDKKQANMYMGKFADLMRLTLDLSNKETITLEDELKILNLYLELEALRFEEKFSYTIQLKNITDTQAIEIPAMLIQPYVENAVKHGLLHKPGEKKLDILFEEKDNKLICIVRDNGIGRKRSGEINTLRQKKYTSFATGATQKRLELLNYNKPEIISVHYTDLYNNNQIAEGTEVQITIPI
jgi:ligand-binding sensor domain-containing protein